MKSRINILFVICFALFALILTSCQQEEMDDTIVITDPALVDTTTVTDPNSCSGVLTFNGGPAPITPAASAYVFNETCPTSPYQDSIGMTFVSIMADSYVWGSSGPTVGLAQPGNGIPGVEFYGMAPLQTGVSYYSIGGLFNYMGGGVNILYHYNLAEIMLTEVGDQEGDNIAGSILFYSWNPATNDYDTSDATFCVPIALICD